MTQDADTVAIEAVRSFLTEAESDMVTDDDIRGVARAFVGKPNPRMVANRIFVLLRRGALTDGSEGDSDA